MMSILMKNNNIFRIFSLSILMCDLYRGYKTLPEFRTKFGVRLIHGCDLCTGNYGTPRKYSHNNVCTKLMYLKVRNTPELLI